MNRDELLEKLRSMAQPELPPESERDPNKLYFYGDPEYDHAAADEALLDFIADPEISEAYDAIKKWYA